MRDYHVAPADAPDPSLAGPYEYRTYFYGSGTDKRRKEYGENVDFKTEPVNAKPFMGIFDKMSDYWGFDFDRLPLNGRIWFPQGAGPFPLVLIVHGNHNMKEFSDPGYEYLGKLLASRGFVTVSVDENFLNTKFWGENDARAFVLLEHLNLWRQWNQTKGHEFEGKVAMDRVALVGHSRGGESVAHAAAFNRLSRYPDDASVMLDYNFSIRSVIAIAPCEGQYKPAGHPTTLDNLNYLVIQGGHDTDVSTFEGLNQFNRVYFTDDKFHFKSAIYIYRANHSRFNTAWGMMDCPAPASWLMNDQPLMSPEKQRQVAKVLICAFLETTLNDKEQYLPIFKDIRKAAPWLPEDIYVNQYKDSNFKFIADFDEDFDVTTTTLPGGQLLGENLEMWKESHVQYRTKNKPAQENATVVLEWKRDCDPNKIASYAIILSPETTTDLGLDPNTNLVFSIGAADEEPNEFKPLDLTIELCDADGDSALLPLSTVGPIHPPLTVRLTKWKWREKNLWDMSSERLLQTYEIPMSIFMESSAAFDPAKLQAVRFIFDRSPKGKIMLDDIGMSM